MKSLLTVFLLLLLCISVSPQGNASAQALLLARNGEYGQSLPLLTDLLKNNTNNSQDYSTILYYHAVSAEKTGDTILALSSYTLLIQKFLNSPYRSLSLFNSGILLKERGYFKDARERFSELISVYPNDENKGKSYFFIGETFLREGKEKEALDFFIKALKKSEQSTFLDEIFYSMGVIFEKKGEYQKAIEQYEQVVSKFKESDLYPRAQVRIGLCYYKMQEFGGTIVELGNPVLKKLPAEEQEKLLPLLGSSFYISGEFENAAKTLVEFIAKYPAHPELREYKYTLGWCHFNLKRYTDAFKIFQDLGATENDSITRESLFWKAECLRLLNKADEAAKAFKAYLERYPESNYKLSVLFLQALLKYNQKGYTEAKELLQQTTKSKDNGIKSKSAILLGDIENRAGRYSTSVSIYTDALKIPGITTLQQAQMKLGRAIALFFLPDIKSSAAAFEELMNNYPTYEPDLVAFYLAECAYSSKNFAKAFRYYQMVNTGHPDVGTQTLTGKAYAAYNDKDFTAAAYAFLDLSEKSGDDGGIYKLRAADCYYAEKNFTDAIKYYTEYLNGEDNKEKEYALYQIALAYYRTENFAKAQSELKKLTDSKSSGGYVENALYLTGWIFFQQNKFSEAIEQYEAFLRRFPSSKNVPLIQYSIADAAYNLADYDKAVERYSIILNQYPGSSFLLDAVNGLQYAYQAKGEIEKAAEAIDVFLSKNKNNAFADQLALKKGELYFNAGNYEQAVNSFKFFIQSYPKSKFVPDVYLRIGKSYQSLGNEGAATEQFLVIVNTFTGSESAPAAAVELVAQYTVSADYESALEVLNKVLPLHGKSVSYPELLYSKARIFQMKNDGPSAYDIYEELAQYSETSIFGDQAKVEMAVMDIQGSRFDKASKALKTITEKRKDDVAAKAHFYLGECYFKMKNIDEALTSYVRVINSFSAYTEWVIQAYSRTAECYEVQGDKVKVKQIYKIIIEKFPDSAQAMEAEKRLKKLK